MVFIAIMNTRSLMVPEHCFFCAVTIYGVVIVNWFLSCDQQQTNRIIRKCKMQKNYLGRNYKWRTNEIRNHLVIANVKQMKLLCLHLPRLQKLENDFFCLLKKARFSTSTKISFETTRSNLRWIKYLRICL